MNHKLLLLLVAMAAVITSWTGAEAGQRHKGTPDLFYNYYTPASGYAGPTAQLYLSPRPTPPMVGHTYVTYQPLMPHEFLRPHHRKYHRSHPDGGRTTTSVTWTRDWDLLGKLKRGPRPINQPRWCK